MNSFNFKSLFYSTKSYVQEFISMMFSIIKSDADKSDISVNEILFYGVDDKKKCEQVGLNNILCIYFVIVHATRTVDVCMPKLVSETITKCLSSVARKSSTKIRVTVHDTDDFQNLQSLAEDGIEVRVYKSAVALEHEFILVDASESFEDAVAVVGSLDYETDRVNCNRDATVITSDSTVVEAFKREFDRVWYSSAIITFENEEKHDRGFVEESN